MTALPRILTAAGMTMRPSNPDDVDAVYSLGAEIGRHLGSDPLFSRADLIAHIDHPGMDLQRDSLVVVGRDGSIAGHALAYDEVPGRTDLEAIIDPALDAALGAGVADALLAWGVAAAAAIATRRHLPHTVLSVWAAKSDVAMCDAYARNGFSYARTFFAMRRALADPAELKGHRSTAHIRQVNTEDQTVLELLRRLNNETFRDHYGHVPRDEEAFAHEVRSAAGYDPHAAWIADVDGEDVGFLVGSARVREDGRGYVAMLGVRHEVRGRGIGRALLLESFAYYAARGCTDVDLGVDAENTTGATRLYEAVGMHTVEEHQVWELLVGAA